MFYSVAYLLLTKHFLIWKNWNKLSLKDQIKQKLKMNDTGKRSGIGLLQLFEEYYLQHQILGFLISSSAELPYEELEFRGPISSRKCTNIFSLIPFLISLSICIGAGIYSKLVIFPKRELILYSAPFLSVLNVSVPKQVGFNDIQQLNDMVLNDIENGQHQMDLYISGSSIEPRQTLNMPEKFGVGLFIVSILIGTGGCLTLLLLIYWLAELVIWAIIVGLEIIVFLSEYYAHTCYSLE